MSGEETHSRTSRVDVAFVAHMSGRCNACRADIDMASATSPPAEVCSGRSDKHHGNKVVRFLRLTGVVKRRMPATP